MSKKASQFQKRVMSLGYRGKEIFKPLNTGWIDEHTACIREWIANIFFYTKNGTTIMIDAGYNYDRLAEKMRWLDIDPSSIQDILITHQDTDHVGAVERDSDGLFRHATLYLSEVENRYMTGEVRRKVIFGTYKLPMVDTDNKKVLLKDGDVFTIDGIRNVMEQNRNGLNEMIPAYEKISEIEIYEEEFEKTPKRSIKRYLYK